MKKLVRRLLVHYDRYGVVAALAWFLICCGLIAVTFIPLNAFFLHVLHIKPQLSVFPTLLLISPIVVYLAPTVWACGFLVAERMWMIVGIHAIKGWEAHKFRKLIGRLAGEQ